MGRVVAGCSLAHVVGRLPSSRAALSQPGRAPVCGRSRLSSGSIRPRCSASALQCEAVSYFSLSTMKVATLAAAATAATITAAICNRCSCHHNHRRAACSLSPAHVEALTFART